ncbi:MAG: radical SAM family heme chaperone HemW [Gammaproteobacteria bacterium]|nr:MAG: radical SAM family heme chaperone HemW [Gammaproteobacteria bacterium]
MYRCRAESGAEKPPEPSRSGTAQPAERPSEPPVNLPPLSLYVHIPWCVRKCPYCDFNSHAADTLQEATYVEALLRDLEQDAPLAQGRQLTSIFFGGGTPSLFSAESIDRVLAASRALIGWEDDIEITLEANPGASEAERFAGYRQAGVNRLSIGVQSFNAAHLQVLGRIHDPDQAVAAFEAARVAGFERINLDLMHGLPEQTPEQALADLDQAIRLGPEHLSWYQLTLEPNTEFYSRPPSLPDDETLWAIQDAGHARLARAGYAQYEVSAYARPGERCRHNLNYWLFGDYLGIGAGAHGKVTHSNGQIERRAKTRLPRHYLARETDFLSDRHTVPARDLPFEFAMNVLRLVDGADENLYKLRTGQPTQTLRSQLAPWYAREALVPGRWQCTPNGLRFLNEILTSLIPDDGGDT